MNLLAHDIVKHLLVQVQHHNYAKHKQKKKTQLFVLSLGTT